MKNNIIKKVVTTEITYDYRGMEINITYKDTGSKKDEVEFLIISGGREVIGPAKDFIMRHFLDSTMWGDMKKEFGLNGLIKMSFS